MSDFESLGDALKRLGIPIPAVPLGQPDQIVAGPDCERWCRGQGYRRSGSTFVEGAAGELRSISEIVERITYDYCRCEPGERAQQRHQEARAALIAATAQREANRIWEAAQLPSVFRNYTLVSYLELPCASPAIVEKLCRWQRSDSAWLLLWGSVGVAKTGLSVALLREALAAGQSGLYVAVPDFLERIRLTYRQSGESAPDETDVLASLANVDVLLLDDIGKAPLTDWGREKLYTVISRRDGAGRRTLITTNLSPVALEAHVGGATFDRIRGRAVDRATGEGFAIELTGESLRGLAVARG